MYIQLSDKQWEAIADYLPPINMNGRPRCEDRAVINGILYVLKTGCQWPAIPKEYGVHYSTCWRRLKRWEENGTWQRIIAVFSPRVRWSGFILNRSGSWVQILQIYS